MASVILLVAYVFFLKNMRKTAAGVLACACLLAALAGLQFFHWQFIVSGAELFDSRAYVALLLVTPPSFFFFSREILFPESRVSMYDSMHLVPLFLSVAMPAKLVMPVAFVVGTAYSIWLVRVVYGMRRNIRRFKFEAFFFALFAVLAILVLGLGVLSRYGDSSIFYVSYTYLIGIAFVLVVAALVSFPELLDDISSAAQLTYANSTLGGVNVDQKLHDLDRLLREEKIFQNENLNLGLLAEELSLSSHQLSELINTRFGMGFSRYIREQRVSEAKRMLREDGSTSVLSISLATGFNSQSNFYTAFREITGMSPGAYRKSHHFAETDS